MNVEKRLKIAVPKDKLWPILLDPKEMAPCIPGVQSVEVVSDTEYITVMKVSFSFISATFTVRTTIVEAQPPQYLRAEGAGEDSRIASSMKFVAEMSLNDDPDGGTELVVTGKADIYGRLGTFGLAAMKTKIDRLWDDFGVSFTTRVATVFSPDAGVE